MTPSTAHPRNISRCAVMCCGAGQMIATPPCLPPRGPGLASEANTPTRGIIPARQVAAAISSHRLSRRNTTAP
eukprot:11158427-Lingulodinium_polyedra.AAC.1